MRKILLILITLLSIVAWGQSNHLQLVPIKGEYVKTQTLTPFIGKYNLHALTISGSVTLNSDTSLVRVIMHDVKGKSYLIYEATPMLINGKSDEFYNAGEETNWMCGIVPQDLKIIIKDAVLTLSEMTPTPYNPVNHPLRNRASNDSIRIKQVKTKVDRINAYLRSHNCRWFATMSDRNMLSYSDKGCDDSTFDYIDYYGGGIIEIGSRNSAINRENPSSFVPDFDWRCRHGINWTTPVKRQMFPEFGGDSIDSGYCIQFGALGAMESLENIYYNTKIDSDYSEQDLKNMCVQHPEWDWRSQVSNCLLNYGVTIEDSCRLSINDDHIRKASWPVTKITGYRKIFTSERVNYNNIDSIKSALIHHGPMLSCIARPNHAMALLGYRTINVGDTIELLGNGDDRYQYRIEEGDDLIGRTLWIYKDSYGLNHPYDSSGFMYVVFNDYSDMTTPVYFEGPMIYSSGSIITPAIEDRDGDGYYTWGFNLPKPSSLPDWVPDEQDGDDSDPRMGMMDWYGFLHSSCTNDTIYIDEDTEWATFHYIRTPIVVRNGSTLTISAECKVVPGVVIIVRDASTLIINDKGFETVSIIGENGANVILEQNSRQNVSRLNENFITLRR